jgi:hypothetical protein
MNYRSPGVSKNKQKESLKKGIGLEKFWRRQKCRCVSRALFNMRRRSERMKNKRAVRDGKKNRPNFKFA